MFSLSPSAQRSHVSTQQSGGHLQTQEENSHWKLIMLALDFRPPELWENNHLLLEPPSLWCYVVAVWAYLKHSDRILILIITLQ